MWRWYAWDWTTTSNNWYERYTLDTHNFAQMTKIIIFKVKYAVTSTPYIYTITCNTGIDNKFTLELIRKYDITPQQWDVKSLSLPCLLRWQQDHADKSRFKGSYTYPPYAVTTNACHRRTTCGLIHTQSKIWYLTLTTVSWLAVLLLWTDAVALNTVCKVPRHCDLHLPPRAALLFADNAQKWPVHAKSQ